MPSVWEALTAGGAVLSFTIIEISVYFSLRHRLEEELEVMLLGSVFSFLSIGLALTDGTWVAERFLGGLSPGPLGAPS
jgi:hypothetical protein